MIAKKTRVEEGNGKGEMERIVVERKRVCFNCCSGLSENLCEDSGGAEFASA